MSKNKKTFLNKTISMASKFYNQFGLLAISVLGSLLLASEYSRKKALKKSEEAQDKLKIKEIKDEIAKESIDDSIDSFNNEYIRNRKE